MVFMVSKLESSFLRYTLFKKNPSSLHMYRCMLDYNNCHKCNNNSNSLLDKVKFYFTLIITMQFFNYGNELFYSRLLELVIYIVNEIRIYRKYTCFIDYMWGFFHFRINKNFAK